MSAFILIVFVITFISCNNRSSIKKNSLKLELNKGIIVVELELLGLEYVSSKGKETTVTRHFNAIFSEALDKL
ncbi:hypothetical protein [Dokdonia pacifica]|nr:hypothetical protein [Dokdonia pacifica]